MDSITDSFDERLQEIDAYLDLLDALQRQAQSGPPQIGGSVITAQQQKILYSSVYLQLYNLVEATANWCVTAVAEATADNSRWTPKDLDSPLLREWVRHTGRTHANLNFGHRLDQAVELCESIFDSRPITNWTVEKGGGGNWDDYKIESIAKRIGCDLAISNAVKSAAKRTIRDDKNSLGLVRELRNRLAHGLLSFEQCGNGVTVFDLRDIKDRTANYLREVVAAFVDYIDNYRFLSPGCRPTAGGTP